MTFKVAGNIIPAFKKYRPFCYEASHGLVYFKYSNFSY
jgi:hypothetical protein